MKITDKKAVSVEEFRDLVGFGRDKAYHIARQIGIKHGRRIIIPMHRVDAFLRGEIEVSA